MRLFLDLLLLTNDAENSVCTEIRFLFFYIRPYWWLGWQKIQSKSFFGISECFGKDGTNTELKKTNFKVFFNYHSLMVKKILVKTSNNFILLGISLLTVSSLGY